ncbi:beta-hydroxyacyl-ACP dehydratase [Solihabitans fulvus]|uniref:Beta-hydroxyacyl-ACP dehydratase n=1 Tax=Solihabitans fulvus TaxID=1892852 RepID=A0A5B2XS80_9PSEU|nr:beta-hydroxyacyl-ACP dehydratase [Solihabitans fulvus]KAA2265792.1 beta-hydroxyacyl-ACP dehydratase [Solihabitans fulvus]
MSREYGEIRAILPHGPQMVLLDRVEWLDPGRALRAVKAISGGEPCYQRLPAGLPRRGYAYPRSLILESFGQAAAVLWHSLTGRLADQDSLLMFAAARSCRFEGHAYPGEVLRHEVALERCVADTAFATGSTWVGERRIASMGSLIAVVRTRPE